MSRIDLAPTGPAAAAAALRARGLAMAGYGLVIASFFTVWLTGLAAWLLAFLNRKTPDDLARSHFRNQLKITDIFGLVSAIGIALALWGGWTAIAPVFQGGEFSFGRLFGASAWVLLGLGVWALGTLVAIVQSVTGGLRLLRGEMAKGSSTSSG